MTGTGDNMSFGDQFFADESFTLFQVDFGLEGNENVVSEFADPVSDHIDTNYNMGTMDHGADTSQYVPSSTYSQSLPHHVVPDVQSSMSLPTAVSFQTYAGHQTFGDPPASAALRECAASHSGPTFRFQSFNDNLGAWEDTNASNASTRAASPFPTSRLDLATNPLAFITGMDQYRPIYNTHNVVHSYPAQLKGESEYDAGQIPSHMLSSDLNSPGLGPPLSGYFMERSFPEHMYTAESSFAEISGMASWGTPSSAYMSETAATPLSLSNTSPATSLTSALPTAGDTVEMNRSCDGDTMPQQSIVTPTTRTRNAGFDTQRASFMSNESMTQPTALSRFVSSTWQMTIC